MIIKRRQKQFTAQVVGATKSVLSAINSATKVPNAQLASKLKEGAKRLGNISGQPRTILRGKSGTALITRHYDKSAPKLKLAQPQPRQLELFPGFNGGPQTESNMRVLAAGKRTRNSAPLIRAKYHTANTTTNNEVIGINTLGAKSVKIEPPIIPGLFK